MQRGRVEDLLCNLTHLSASILPMIAYYQVELGFYRKCITIDDNNYATIGSIKIQR